MDTAVTRVFDAMAEHYDELEPWYEHFYRVLHAILREALAGPAGSRSAAATGRRVRRPRALDIGCGTGYQTAILADLGYETHGADLAARPLEIARDRVPGALLVQADAETLPYADAAFDAIACCGSTLSLLETPARTLAECGRLLRPGGRLLLECEHRWSLDLGWALVSALTGDSLGYGMTVRQALRALLANPRRGVVVPYPVPVSSSEVTTLRLRLFTRPELEAWLTRAGFRIERICGIHAVTNTIPSTILHRPRLSRAMAALYGRLTRLDQRLGRSRVGGRLASSVVVSAVRR